MNYSSFLLAVFMVVAFLDPTNRLFGLKEILFGLVFLVYSIKLLRKGKGIDRFSLLFLSFVFGVMLLLGILAGNRAGMDLGTVWLYVKAFLFLALLPFARQFHEEFIQAFRWAGAVLALVCLALIFDFWIEEIDFSYDFIVTETIGVGWRPFGELKYPIVFHKSSPLLILFMAWHLLKASRERSPASWFWIAVSSLVLGFSGTRANLFAACAMLAFGLYLMSPKKWRGLLAGLVISITALPVVDFVFKNFFYAEEHSLAIKAGHVDSYVTLFADNPGIILTGWGLGQGFYTSGFDAFVQVTELVYLDMIRIWGLPLVAVFIFNLSLPVWLKTTKPIFRIAGLGYLIVAGTNPLLISSTGFTAMLVLQALGLFESGVDVLPKKGIVHDQHLGCTV